jgi:hypothetical protein
MIRYLLFVCVRFELAVQPLLSWTGLTVRKARESNLRTLNTLTSGYTRLSCKGYTTRCLLLVISRLSVYCI